MAKLNEYNDQTKGKIHLMVTTLCDRDCKYCCNKQYDFNDIPQVTDEELKNCHTVYLTGGEPFLFSNPNTIAWQLKRKYSNIKTVRVYTNARALYMYMYRYGSLDAIDGLSVSIKDVNDLNVFRIMLSDYQTDIEKHCKSNVLYAFAPCRPRIDIPEYPGNFKVIEREWQEDFVPEPTSIFRRI